MCKRLYVKCSLFLSDFNETWIFSTDIQKKAEMSSFIKIRLVRVEVFRADGRTDRQTEVRTDMTKLIIAILNFANAPNKTSLFFTFLKDTASSSSRQARNISSDYKLRFLSDLRESGRCWKHSTINLFSREEQRVISQIVCLVAEI
jgi:hypothetical protein